MPFSNFDVALNMYTSSIQKYLTLNFVFNITTLNSAIFRVMSWALWLLSIGMSVQGQFYWLGNEPVSFVFIDD